MSASILAQRIHALAERTLNEHARQALLKNYVDKDPALALGEVCGFHKGLKEAFDLVLKELRDEDRRNERPPEPDSFA